MTWQKFPQMYIGVSQQTRNQLVCILYWIRNAKQFLHPLNLCCCDGISRGQGCESGLAFELRTGRQCRMWRPHCSRLQKLDPCIHSIKALRQGLVVHLLLLIHHPNFIIQLTHEHIQSVCDLHLQLLCRCLVLIRRGLLFPFQANLRSFQSF